MKKKIKFLRRIETNDGKIIGKNRIFRHLHTTKENIHIYLDVDFGVTIGLTEQQLQSEKIKKI